MSKFMAAATLSTVLVWAAATAPVLSGAGPDDVYQAIRANDLTRLGTLVRTKADANAKDESGDTLLMRAAAIASVDAVKLLVDAGADVNGRNMFDSTPLVWAATDLAKVRYLIDQGADVNAATKTGRTPLFVAAMSDQSAPIVRLLLSKGANAKAPDAFGNTTLVAAAFGNDTETIRLILDAGVDANAVGATGMTPLIAAAHNDNLAAVRLLLSKGANVNAVAKGPGLFPIDSPKSGPIALSNDTALLAAAGTASPAVIGALVAAGADVNAKDGRGFTPLMLAIIANRQDAGVIKLLLDRGADLKAQSNTGETAGDWARKMGGRVGLDALKLTAAPAAVARTLPLPDVKAATERSVALLETSSQKFFEGSGCVSCHHQNITDMAAGELRSKGLRVDPAAAGERMKMLAAAPPPSALMDRMDISVPEILAATLSALASNGVPPNATTDKLAVNLAAAQLRDGSWHLVGAIGNRPPTQEGDIARTAQCVRALKVYGPPSRPGLAAQIAKARDWLLAAKPVSSEQRNMRLLGLYWAGADAATLKPLVAEILAAQQRDGGWRQIDTLAPDAYATGQSLYALAKAGVSPTDPAYQRGVAYLLATQAENGSWRVASRAAKFQAYFNSGFPYAGDQWISAWATGWAAMALAQTVPTPPRTAAR
jgi:ankyrin repeat protein